MKQFALAEALGLSQQSISIMEASETIDDDKLKQIAKALDVSVEAIENFSEEGVINYFTNNFNDSSSFNNLCTFNPLDKLMETMEEENRKLYERLLESEKEKNEYLERMLKGK